MSGRLHTGPRSVPWHVTYLTVTALSIGLVAAVWHLFPQFRHSSDLGVAGVVVGMFTVTSLLHWYDVTANGLPLRRR